MSSMKLQLADSKADTQHSRIPSCHSTAQYFSKTPVCNKYLELYYGLCPQWLNKLNF